MRQIHYPVTARYLKKIFIRASLVRFDVKFTGLKIGN